MVVFHGRHFVRHLGICSPICVKLLQVMSGFILHNLEKNDVFLRSTNAAYIHTQTHTRTDTDTHTHEDSMRRNAIRCISPKNHSKTGRKLSRRRV